MAAVDPRKIGQILVEKGIVSLPQLEQALEEQRTTGRFLGEILVGRGVAKEEAVARALSEQLGFAYVDVNEMSVEDRAADLVPRELCEKYTLVPVFVSQNTLTVAMANALDVAAIDKVQSQTGLRVRPVFACPSSIRKALSKRSPSAAASVPAGARLPDGQAPPVLTAENVMTGSMPAIGIPTDARQADQKPVIERVNEIIERAVEMGASDIHLEPEKIQLVCRYRIDGILHTMPALPAEEHAAIVSRVKIMADMDIAEKRLPQDGRIRLVIRGREVDLRVSTFPSVYGENLVMRILDRSGGLISLNDLGFAFKNLETFQRMIRRPYGMILVTGPTGSGKTTTLYAALSEINDSRKNIITLEDPVEYELPQVRQSQINVKAGLTFATGLRSVVRQDPDVIMIGEIRDRETAEIAIHAALTGHLVVSTLHTNDAPSAAARLIDMGVEPFLVSTSVIGILAQRLLRTLCTSCKSAYRPSEDLLLLLGLKPEEHAQTVFYREKGCEKCKQFGYHGRAGIYELMVPTDKIRDLISRKVSAAVIKEEAAKAGMRTLREAGIEKVIAGQTSVAEVLRVTEEI